ncbi:YicC/YloC family endoribonuclease [Candidatus Omnitrophota bacterium]
MRITIEKQVLLESLGSIVGVVNPKNTLPILSNILLEAVKDNFKLTATNLDIGMISSLVTTVTEEGAITVPAKRFIDIIKESPDGPIEIYTKRNNMVIIEGGGVVFKILGIPKDEFPKLPLLTSDDKIRETVQRKISRGRLNLFLSFDKKGTNKDEVQVDKKLGKLYYKKLLNLKRDLGIKGDIKIDQILPLPGVVTLTPQEEDVGRLWPLINKALHLATEDLIHSRAREGRMLKKNIQQITRAIEFSLKKIKARAPLVVKEYKKRLIINVNKLTRSKRALNPGRMEEEAAVFARNCDIAEEIHRVSAHIVGFKKVLANNGESGRRLDFIGQELYREVNTIGAKANDFPISREVIKVKSLIEKIREQVQNVE